MKMTWIFCLLWPLLAQSQIYMGSENFGNLSNPMVDDTLAAKRDKLAFPNDILFYDALNVNEVQNLNSETRLLQKIKYYILNGEVRLARLYLDKLNYSQTNLRPIIYRYQGILHFITGNFERSYDYLSRADLQAIPNFGKICLVKLFNEIALNKKNHIEKTYARCLTENARFLNVKNLPWLSTLVDLKVNPAPGVTSAPFRKLQIAALDNNDLKTFLKMALYLNQEAYVVPQFKDLEFEQISDPEIRELMGHLYFRTGELANSYKFIEGLSSPNTENIRGNLYLMRQKYELAYAQFKLALEQKQNSQNAIERLLPLAWIMKDWQKGVEYAERVIASPQTQVNKLTIISAFLLQTEKYDQAKDLLNVITQRSRFGYHLDAAQINAFVGLIQNTPNSIRKSARSSCDQYDLIYCWVAMQMDTWDMFPLALRRKDKVMDAPDWEKLTVQEINEPLKETAYVNQVDIEELDDSLVKLIEKPQP